LLRQVLFREHAVRPIRSLLALTRIEQNQPLNLLTTARRKDPPRRLLPPGAHLATSVILYERTRGLFSSFEKRSSLGRQPG
jgi:hypothetical protein